MQYKLYIVISTNYETYTYTVVYNINVVIVFYMQAMMINIWASEWVKDVNAKRTVQFKTKSTAYFAKSIYIDAKQTIINAKPTVMQ